MGRLPRTRARKLFVSQQIRQVLALAKGERAMFVVVNVAVNVVFLARSYLTMQALSYRELGLAALLQSIILLVGLTHFGLMNGAYRILCSSPPDEARRVNNLVFTLLGALGIVVVVIALTSLPFISTGDAYLVVVLGALGGVMTLIRTWMSNHMIANGALTRLNRISFWSAMISLLPLALVPVAPLAACLSAIILQPIAFVVAVVLFERPVLPTRIETSWSLTRSVFRVGFVIFLTGIFLQLNVQLERWYITGFLGIEALGHFYLAILFVTLFQMVPNALDQVFLPSIVRAHASGQDDAVRRGMRQLLLVETAYCAAAAIAVIALAYPLISWLLPKYIPDLRYVYLVAPGLILFTLASPLAVPFNVLIRYRYYFIAYGAGSLVTLLALVNAARLGGQMRLDDVALLRSGVYGLMAVVTTVGFFRVTRGHDAFRLRTRHERDAGHR